MNSFSKIILICLALTILFFSKSYSQSESIDTYLEGMKITAIKNDGVDIWVTTEGNGIYKYIKWKNKWINFSTENNTLKQNFFYCLEVGTRYIWAGSPDGLYTYDKKRNRWTKKRFSLGGQFGNWIRSLKFDKEENKLWIGRFKYLSQFDLISKKYSDFDLTVNNNDKTNSVLDINIDGDSVIWIGVEAGLHKYVKSNPNFETTYFDSKNNYFLNEGDQVSVSSILFEQDNIWFGTDEFVTMQNPKFNLGGLFRFDRKINWIRFGEFANLNGSGIFSLELTGNYIWSASYKFEPKTKSVVGKGLNLINRKTLQSKRIESNFIPETIYTLHFDGESLWIGTNDGIRKIMLKNDLLPDFS
jgi:ligand-binding sensor domain-containing protein